MTLAQSSLFLCNEDEFDTVSVWIEAAQSSLFLCNEDEFDSQGLE